MWDKHWERVDSFLKKWKMVQEGDSILLGISGGADSVCLARYFLARREALSLKLYAVHINHMLRGEEAKRDEEFVQDFCHKWNLSLNVEYRFAGQWKDYPSISLFKQGRNHGYSSKYRAELCR